MLGAVRRFGVAQALRAPISRSLVARSTPQLLQWQPSSRTAAIPQLIRSFHVSSPVASAAAQAQAVDVDSTAAERLTEFADLSKHGLVNTNIINTITKGMKISTMTDVQSMTMNETLQGDDVLAQARTGTGKTLAFLIPVVQNIMKTLEPGRRYASGNDVRGIIISPTRELAEQIAVEALKISRGTGVIVQTAVGGSQKREKLQAIRREGCHLLVGTPGRLKDILSDPRSGVAAPRLGSFVLDEADRLLDDGFAPDIKEIEELLPARHEVDRQTLLFSATVPREVMSMVRRTMKPDFKFVKTVRDDEVPTHMRVPQKGVILPGLENALPAVLEIAKNYTAKARGTSEPSFKAIIYFNSTCEVSLAYEAFNELRSHPDRPLGRMSVFELHSRLTQGRRTKNADYFRKAESGLLFSSDVSARGMDFPNVTHVIQIGIAQDKPSYIHRLGRTGRANKSGEGWILLHRQELGFFKRQLGELPIDFGDSSLATTKVDMTQGLPTDDSVSTDILKHMGEALAQVPEEVKNDAFMSQLGSMAKSFPRKEMMIQALNDLCVHGYSSEPPHLSPGLVAKLGLNSSRGSSSRSRGPPRDDRFGRRNDRNDRGGFRSPSESRSPRWTGRGNGGREGRGGGGFRREFSRDFS